MRCASAIETFQVRLPNSGFADSGIRCVFENRLPLIGYAATARMRSAKPPMLGHGYFYERTDWWKHILSIPAPRVVVIEDVDNPPGLGAFIGEVNANILLALECLGLVTNGSVRDLDQVGLTRFQMFAGSVSVSHAYAHIFDFGGTVDVGGLKIQPGDLIHGDRHGVQTVPLEIAEKVPAAAHEILHRRQQLIGLCLITALTSDAMIAPSYWVDPKSGNNYFVTVQYPENQVKSLEDLKAMPLRAPHLKLPTYLNQVADVTPILTPTEVDHYQLQRTIDVYVAPSGEDLSIPAKEISRIVSATQLPANIRINIRGLVTTMQSSFRSFGFGLFLAVLLVYLVLVAQFSSFLDPFLILLAVPTGLVGVMLTLAFTDTTLNIQSLMGIVMLTGMVVSNSILIVDFANRLRNEGRGVRDAVAHSCRIRLRPILMTSLATIGGLLPMALKIETGSEAYAPLARVIIGGLVASVLLTIFVVPAAYLWIYQRRAGLQTSVLTGEAQ